MKLTFTHTVILLGCIAFFSISCRRSQVDPVYQKTGGNQTTGGDETTGGSPVTLDYSALSGQIAASLFHSLNVKYNGMAADGGIKGPVGIAQNIWSAFSAGVKAGGCGVAIDTTFKYNLPPGDTSETSSGRLTYIFNCNANAVDGYNATSIDTLIESNSHFRNFQIASQEYTVKAMDQTYKLVTVNGHASDTISAARYDGSFYSPFGVLVNSNVINTKCLYVLTGFVVNLSDGPADVRQGSATFNVTNVETDVNNPNGKAYSFKGIITFLGNNKVKIAFDEGTTATGVYYVDLLTGVTTAG